MSHARVKTQLFCLSNYLPWSTFLIDASVGKPDFRGISSFLVVSVNNVKKTNSENMYHEMKLRNIIWVLLFLEGFFANKNSCPVYQKAPFYLASWKRAFIYSQLPISQSQRSSQTSDTWKLIFWSQAFYFEISPVWNKRSWNEIEYSKYV